MRIARWFVTAAVAVAAPATTTPGPVSVDFQHVNLHVAPQVVLEARRLRGTLRPTHVAQSPSFDDELSYTLHIESAEIAMTPAGLSALLNSTAFAGRDSPVSDVRVSIEDGHVTQKGTLRKGVRVPFTLVGDLSATPDGQIRMHPISMKAAGIPAGAVLRLFHLDLADLMKVDASRGVTASKDDLILDPSRLLPPPHASGKVTAVRIEGDRIVQVFGTPLPPARAAGPKNYMHYVGNVLRFGRLTMANTDLEIVDDDPADPFEFSPREYAKQLVAGYSKTQPDGSVIVHMPDLDDLRSDGKR
jgi:hypothetical protein